MVRVVGFVYFTVSAVLREARACVWFQLKLYICESGVHYYLEAPWMASILHNYSYQETYSD
jgi:hypothetical protein